MPGPHKGLSTQCTTQQQHAKPRHQPSDRDQQARDRLIRYPNLKPKLKAEHIYNWVHRHYQLYIRLLIPIYL